MIRKVKGGYETVGNQTGRNLGVFPTKAAAHKRELQVQYFKYGKKPQNNAHKK